MRPFVGSLEDQLKQWKKANAAPEPKAASSKPTKKKTKTSSSSPKKAPPLQTIRRDDPPPPPAPPPMSDAELFAAAVESVDDNVALDKFAATPAPVKVRGQGLPPAPKKTDADLFAEFVGPVNKR